MHAHVSQEPTGPSVQGRAALGYLKYKNKSSNGFESSKDGQATLSTIEAPRAVYDSKVRSVRSRDQSERSAQGDRQALEETVTSNGARETRSKIARYRMAEAERNRQERHAQVENEAKKQEVE